MNKQEAIEKIEKLEGLTIKDKDFNLDIEMIPKGDVLEIIEQIDELEKPVVPKYVADFISSEQRSCSALSEAIDNMEMRDEGEVTGWFYDNSETFAKAWLYGYEVEKEKLYLASFRDTNQYLGWNEKLGEWFMSCSPFTSGVEQTQETWEGVEIWNNPAFEIKEVDE